MTAQQFLASLPTWENADCLAQMDKDDVLAAEVRLPVPAGFTGQLVAVEVRRPYRARSELIVVDVCRLRVS